MNYNDQGLILFCTGALCFSLNLWGIPMGAFLMIVGILVAKQEDK